MREVEFKNKKAQHTLYIQGKAIQFINGKAEISEAEAEAIESSSNEDYKVLPRNEPEPVKIEQPKKQKSKSNKSKK